VARRFSVLRERTKVELEVQAALGSRQVSRATKTRKIALARK
jgi:hypothetical protein